MNIFKGDQRYLSAVKIAKIKPQDKVLDIGGSNAILLNYLPHNLNYTCIDFEDTIKEHFVKSKSKKKYKFINHNLQNGFPKKLNQQKFNIIFILDTLEYLENYKTFLEECKNHLTQNGKIIITIPSAIRYVRNYEWNVYHSFRKENLINLANSLNLKYKLEGIHLRIPFFNLFIPSKNTFYNDTLLIVMYK